MVMMVGVDGDFLKFEAIIVHHEGGKPTIEAMRK
jgi:hypothetical protein